MTQIFVIMLLTFEPKLFLLRLVKKILIQKILLLYPLYLVLLFFQSKFFKKTVVYYESNL